MLKLAKILHSRGFHVTFVNTEYNHRRLLRSRGPNALAGLPSFRYETIPDGLPQTDADADADATQDVPSLCDSTERLCVEPFRALLAKLNGKSLWSGSPPVNCIVSDAVMFFTIEAAEELGIPAVLLWTSSTNGLWGYAQYDKLVELGIVPFRDASFMTNGDLDRVLDWIPAMEGIRLRDIPSFIRTTDPNNFMLCYVRRLLHKMKRASAILLNSFDALDDEILPLLSSSFPPLYTLGPLQLLLDPIEAKDERLSTKSIGRSNLWKEDPHCLEWLESYEPGSIVYVNFGSVTVMTNDQLIEFAWGLANSKLPFLWITRPDLVIGESTVLPPEFLVETEGRRLIASWCNQEEVLAHPAIGGFLTHSGWNSTLESICNGVPMICWPFFAEQQTNCWYCCTKWEIGMEIDTNVKRSEIERQVRELMEGEKGKEMKKKALEWKRLARAATVGSNGPSYSNLGRAIKLLMSLKS